MNRNEEKLCVELRNEELNIKARTVPLSTGLVSPDYLFVNYELLLKVVGLVIKVAITFLRDRKKKQNLFTGCGVLVSSSAVQKCFTYGYCWAN